MSTIICRDVTEPNVRPRRPSTGRSRIKAFHQHVGLARAPPGANGFGADPAGQRLILGPAASASPVPEITGLRLGQTR